MTSYQSVMARKNEIMKKAVGIDYDRFEVEGCAFDYERMMREVGYSLDEIKTIQRATRVGQTPLIELRNINRLIQQISPSGKGGRIFLKDEAVNPSGSFKDRRASVSVYQAAKMGYKGVIAATSGNYGAAVASQAAKFGLKCIIVQETFDSRFVGQPEIVEKARACEAYGAEVVQLSVGPELFYYFLVLLEETQYFNASLYTPFGIAGIETLGSEIGEQMKTLTGDYPDYVVVTHAGGGNLTGTARGLKRVGAQRTKFIAASVDLRTLHMASDIDFNRKSFTTGHTGFGIPFAVFPDRSDVPRNAARPLRYMDRYLTITQGEVFYTTEMLAQLEGLQRGPAGNTSLCAAIALARKVPSGTTLVVQETEYTGAGKCPTAQLTFAKSNGIEVSYGHRTDSVPGKNILIPRSPEELGYDEVDMDALRASYIKQVIKQYQKTRFSETEKAFLQEDCRIDRPTLEHLIEKD
ncbi:MAG TPA: 2-amino-4-oxopentanoate thiolase subunit OrtB [Thermotogota bacterium]|mgnify:CR=1 FL=1|nr:2-amino-4-oxopentanoate thiolase subunit OrtB [Thermotogota bacterium]